MSRWLFLLVTLHVAKVANTAGQVRRSRDCTAHGTPRGKGWADTESGKMNGPVA